MRTDAPCWPDDRSHRQTACRLLEELRSALLTETSATLTLERWCRAHGIDRDPTIVVDLDPGCDLPIDAGLRTLLGVAPDEAVCHRHVRLSCAGWLLSEADNWYVPARLTPSMNAVIDEGSVPFGKAVAAMLFTRTTLSSRLLWSPDAVEPSGAALRIPDALIENRAVLSDRAGRGFSLVIETYRSGVLAFPPPGQ